MRLRKNIRRAYFQLIQKLSNRSDINLELSVIDSYPRSQPGITRIFNKPFKFHDGRSFAATYKELFETNIYRFQPSDEARTILDCGANMGLSVLYFALNYPDHKIIAFEADPEIFNILKENVETFGLKNVVLHQKAVWHKHEILNFFSDGGMGGRLGDAHRKGSVTEVEAVPLSEFITDDLDFLKIDIEGAEGIVLNSCKGILSKARHIFFEYHNSIKDPQTLHELLQLVYESGFTYYIKESAVIEKPFIDEQKIGGLFDMALNVFCYKK